MKLTVQAWAGAKIEILGWELSEWSTTFDIIGPWTLLKLPSDGSEHKTPAEQKAEDVKKQREKKINSYANMINNFKEDLENLVIKLIEMDGGDREEKVDMILKKLDSKNTIIMRNLSATYFFNNYKEEVETRYEKFSADKNWKEVVESIKGSEAYNIYDKNLKGWAKFLDFDMIRNNFVKTYGREPKIQDKADMQYLMIKVMDFAKDLYLEHQADYENAYNYLMNLGHLIYSKESEEALQLAAYEAIKKYTLNGNVLNAATNVENNILLSNMFKYNTENYRKILEERDELMKKWDSQ